MPHSVLDDIEVIVYPEDEVEQRSTDAAWKARYPDHKQGVDRSKAKTTATTSALHDAAVAVILHELPANRQHIRHRINLPEKSDRLDQTAGSWRHSR